MYVCMKSFAKIFHDFVCVLPAFCYPSLTQLPSHATQMSMTFDRAGNIGDDIVACHIHIKALIKLLIANFCLEGSCSIKHQAAVCSQQSAVERVNEHFPLGGVRMY